MDRRNFLKGAAKSAVAIAALPIAASVGAEPTIGFGRPKFDYAEYLQARDDAIDAIKYATYQTEFGPLKAKTNAAKQFDARLYAMGSIGDLPNVQNV